MNPSNDERELLATAEIVERRVKVSGRKCGECSLCCHIFKVSALDKPANVWCKHCQPGKGCMIYDRRPPICRAFACGWLLGWGKDHWFPKRARMVIKAFDGKKGDFRLAIHVDPRSPNKWREQPYFDEIKNLARLGLSGAYDFDFQTRVYVGRRKYLIFPDREIDITDEERAIEELCALSSLRPVHLQVW